MTEAYDYESCTRPFCMYQFPFSSKSRNFWPKKELSIHGSRKDIDGRQLWNSGCCSCRFYKIFALDMRLCRWLNWSKRKLQLLASVRKFALLGISGYLSKSLASWVSVEGREKGQKGQRKARKDRKRLMMLDTIPPKMSLNE